MGQPCFRRNRTGSEHSYDAAEQMLGAVENPGLYNSDEALKRVADRYGKSDSFEPTRVAIFFGEPEEEVPDPYFETVPCFLPLK